MPSGTCDPASRGEAFNQTALEYPAPDGSGSVLVDFHWGWDGASVMPNCDGPVTYLKTRNNSNMPCWAMLPLKKRGDTWIQIDAHTDLSPITGSGQLRNLGLSNQSDVVGVGISWTNPGV